MNGDRRQLRIAITGASGLIGRRVAEDLRGAGHVVYPLRRGVGGASQPSWNPGSGEVFTPEPMDALLHFAGRSVATRWTAKAKAAIYDSRVPATERLSRHLASRVPDSRPRLFLCASAIGIYGDRGEEILTESSAPAPATSSFLADVCRWWEAATRPASDAGISVLHLRFGVVLGKGGGALGKMLLPAKLGLAGPVGGGTQFLSWISLTDVSRLIRHLVELDSPLAGVLNVVSSTPVRQHEFARTLAGVLHRPAVFPMPRPLLKLAFGQMGEEMLLASQRVTSERMPADFRLLHPTLQQAIRAELDYAGNGAVRR